LIFFVDKREVLTQYVKTGSAPAVKLTSDEAAAIDVKLG
jgi:hypothetical protein